MNQFQSIDLKMWSDPAWKAMAETAKKRDEK